MPLCCRARGEREQQWGAPDLHRCASCLGGRVRKDSTFGIMRKKHTSFRTPTRRTPPARWGPCAALPGGARRVQLHPPLPAPLFASAVGLALSFLNVHSAVLGCGQGRRVRV